MLSVVMLVLSAGAWLLPLDIEVRCTAAMVVVAGFTLSELTGGRWHRKTSPRRLVPTELINGNDAVAATRWGRSLGFGSLTDAPYGAFHAALAIPVIAGDVLFNFVVVGVFAAARAVPYLIRSIGSNASQIAEFTVKGRGVLFRGIRFLSFATLAAALVWMLL